MLIFQEIDNLYGIIIEYLNIKNDRLILSIKIRTVNNGRIGIIEIRSAFISEDIIDELQDAVGDFIEQGNKKLIIDLSKVNLINSIGLGALIAAHKTFKKNAGEAVLTGVGKSIKNVFVITKLTEVFDIYDRVEDAVEKFSLINI